MITIVENLLHKGEKLGHVEKVMHYFLHNELWISAIFGDNPIKAQGRNAIIHECKVKSNCSYTYGQDLDGLALGHNDMPNQGSKS